MTSIPDINWIFVDDGSTDDTAKKIEELSAKSNVSYLTLDRNRGKAEAVRQGLLQEIQINRTSDVVGFIDADTAIPSTEIKRIVAVASRVLTPPSQFNSLWMSRVKLSGRSITRRTSRHLVGRLLASFLSAQFPNLPYDTQCGFKLFTRTDELEKLLLDKFHTRWFFDLELLNKSREFGERGLIIWEEPLTSWREVGDSHLGMNEIPRVLADLAKLSISRQKPKELF
jgi:dolichyl-phosphate beta-glucosyltransferase